MNGAFVLEAGGSHVWGSENGQPYVFLHLSSACQIWAVLHHRRSAKPGGHDDLARLLIASGRYPVAPQRALCWRFLGFHWRRGTATTERQVSSRVAMHAVAYA
jgi:hypothetical protein